MFFLLTQGEYFILVTCIGMLLIQRQIQDFPLGAQSPKGGEGGGGAKLLSGQKFPEKLHED